MDHRNHLDNLHASGTIARLEGGDGWLAEPEEIVRALVGEGFQEYKNEVVKNPRHQRAAGGMWQGLDPRTGAVASAIWINQPRTSHAIVYVDIDGEPLRAGLAAAGNGRG
jgi:hypothetical protein